MEQCTDDEVNRMLFLVSEQRREQALNFKFTFGRFVCLKAVVILQQMLTELGVIAVGRKVEFDYGEHGKPSLKGIPGIFFNISHCKNGIAVAVDDSPVGIDIECFHEADEGLMRKTMNAEECRCIINADNPKKEFTRLWTQKEAVLKLRGTGLIDDLHGVLNGDELVESHVVDEKQYVWTVARLG
ncbi:MAG: 4'-phosphopantetheinyl transferase superfamily protein [Bacteroidaceae bacterium]|nr:4'-phosphopantetheinyl transferase superfamily protein [Bacteroidaceae bacterium]